MYQEDESSQKIQELAHQLEQISDQVKKTINKAISKNFLSQKSFSFNQDNSVPKLIEGKKLETEAIFSQLQAADQRIEKDLIDIFKCGQETRDLLAKLKAEII